MKLDPATTDTDKGEPLSLAHAKEIERLLNARSDWPSFSEHSFANLFLFRDVHQYRLHLTPLPHIRGMTYDGAYHAMPLVAVDPAVCATLLEACDCLYPLNQTEVINAGPGWAVSDNPDDADYVYDRAAMAAVPSSKRSQVRTLVDHNYPDFGVAPDNFASTASRILDAWLSEVGRPPSETDFPICQEAIALAGTLGLTAMLASADGNPCGFLLYSTLPDRSVAVHFAKATRSLPGLYPYMFSRLAMAAGCGLLNFEQDLGHPGLRRAKKALRPAGQLRKYRLSKR